MSFDELKEQKKVLELVKENWDMSLKMKKFTGNYQLDYLRCIASFLKMGRAYYQNDELTIEELQELYDKEANKSKIFC